MLSKNKIVVGGFVFENEEEAAQAQKEVKGIQYINCLLYTSPSPRDTT